MLPEAILIEQQLVLARLDRIHPLTCFGRGLGLAAGFGTHRRNWLTALLLFGGFDRAFGGLANGRIKPSRMRQSYSRRTPSAAGKAAPR